MLYMQEIYSKYEIANKLKNCAKIYKQNLENKKLLFLTEDKTNFFSFFEIAMFPRNFMHLTGCKIIENNKNIPTIEFYSRFLNNNINEKNIILSNSTSFYKIEILPQLMNLDKNAKILGDYDNSKIYLQTNKLVGNINACIGFIKEKHTYIPNTALNEDIRNITTNIKKVIAVFKKNFNDKMYNQITYLKNNYNISKLLKCVNIKNLVDFQNLTSNNFQIINKISNFKNF